MRLTLAERRRVSEIGAAAAAGRGRFVMSTGGESASLVVAVTGSPDSLSGGPRWRSLWP